MKVRISSLCKWTIYFLFLFDLNIFMLQKISTGDRMLYTVAISAIWTGYIFLRPKSDMYIQSTRWIKRYAAIVFLMLIVHYIYASTVNEVTKGVFLASSYYYLIIIFAFPLVYMFDNDDGTYKFWKTLNIITFIWEMVLIFQAVLYNASGRIILPFLVGRNIALRNGMMRLEMRSMAHVMIIYNFDKFYNQRDKGRLKYLLLTLLGLFTMFYVEQTRGYYIAVVLSLAALLLCYNRESKKFLITSVLVILAVFVLWKTNAIAVLYNSLFSTTGEDATAIVRLRGIEIINERLKNNLLWGFGFQKTGDWFNYGGVVTYFNDNGFIGLMGQIGIWAVLIFGYMVVRFGYIIIDLFRRKSYSTATLLLGLYVYLIGTAPSLICYWNTTCMLCPVLWAVFEYEHTKIMYCVGMEDI